MFSIVKAASRRRSFLPASTLLASGLIGPLLVPFAVSHANAQQSASPNLLPPIEVNPARNADNTEPPVDRNSSSRRVVAAPPQPKPSDALPAGTPDSAPTVVSPTGIVTPAGEVANSITAITAKDIETFQQRTLSDVLSTVPGLNIVQSGGPGAQTSVFIRGTNSNHTKVLIDGIDASDPSNVNGAFDYAHLLTSDMAQVEVLRGPQSGLYGSDAIGGVISIITRKGDGPARTTASIESGSFGTFNQSASLSGSQDSYNYAFNIAHLHAGDVPVTPLQLLPPGQQAIGNNYDNMTYSTKTGVDINESWAMNSVLRYTEATLLFTGDNFNVFPSVPNAAQSNHTVHQFFTREEAVWSQLDGRIKNYFGINYTNYWNSDMAPGDLGATITTGNRIKYDWRSVTQLITGNNLVVGLEQETYQVQTPTLGAESGDKAGFIELQSDFARRFFLVANVREDINDQFGDHMTYRVAPAVILPFTDTKLKASYGTGFKAPTLNQLFQSFPDFNFFANPNLKPEQSVGYDAGFEQPLFNDRVRFGSTYFHNSITDLIDFNSTFTQNINVGLATTEGTENFVAARVTDRFEMRADYTFTRAVNAETGMQLLRRPKEKWSVTAIWKPLDLLNLSATMLHVGDFLDVSRDGTMSGFQAPGYTIVKLTADYAINDQLKAFGRIDNLFNVHYQNPTGFLSPGLGVFGGIRLASYGVK
jgi:vitamin B12 transporter